ncbi:HEAT repeat domain-containing protein [Acetobacterium tundrae]|uniref:HEAT repeat domain-containing protein n=1 Tax=Acetobacterium tundrae TaxID=132932 RepID=A0ABR6WMJ4_9FIRM|nr:HEAT repeat domain-containing protein [Acetobacterium tundrae]MBC3797656.1 hypothetical protein [Acetobacterium tundrae]
MFSNNIQSFVILNIYILIIVNVILLFSIYYEIIKDKIKKKHYEKSSIYLKPKIISYLNDENQKAEVCRTLKNTYLKIVAIDIMLDYAEVNHVNLSEQFVNLDLVNLLIKKFKKKMNIVYLKKLALMGSKNAYNVLMDSAQSEDLDISYMSYFGLSRIKIQNDKKEAAIKKLVVSNIVTDRIIEILRQFDLEFIDWLELLEKEETVKGKFIFIKTIMVKDEIKSEEYSDRMEKFLKDQREVKIAAIQALCNSQNEKYIAELIKIYENEENWQVRVAVAKGLSSFKFKDVEDALLNMTKDSEWWVRYNAIKSIVAMGEDGLFSLIDLSLKSKDENISDLAYYFLNSNQDVYNTVKNIEV